MFMSAKVPTVLIFGHSFVKRMQRDLLSQFDQSTDKNFKLQGTASVYLHVVGGRTVAKLRSFDLHVVEQIAPGVVLLGIGTHDLLNTGPEVVGSNIESLVRLLLDSYFVCIFGVCHVIPRGVSHIDSSRFTQRLEILKQYLSVVLESLPNVFWLFLIQLKIST